MSADERVWVVDDHNRPIGVASRARMRAERLGHRVTYVFVHDGAGRVFVHLRTPIKDVYPGYYDAAAGGVVLAGERYDESARRELAEELGVSGVALTPHLDLRYVDADTQCWGRVYTCCHRGPFRFQPEEVVDGRFEPLAALLDGTIAPLTPDSLLALRRLLEEAGPGVFG